MTGRLISIDGVDGCGKSTQIKLLHDWFESHGCKTLVVRDPGGTKLGEAVREILLHRQEIPLCNTAEMLMYMASRAQLVAEQIKPAIEDGQIVISDRYLLANVVYQGSAGGMEPETIWQVGAIATQELSPDLTVVLDLDASTAIDRLDGEPDRMESRGVEYMSRVRDGFLQQCQRLSDRALVIDGTRSIDEIHAQITSAISERGFL